MILFRGAGLTVLAALMIAGCSQQSPPALPPPPPSASADTEALNRKMAELKAQNPHLPPVAIGTMAAKMVQEEKARGGRPR